VNPHSSEVVAQKVVERIPGEETQAVRYPVCLIGDISVIRLGLPAELTNGLSSLLISSRPDAQSNAIESMLRVLLKNEGVMNTVRLAAPSADLDIMGEAGLSSQYKMG
jgi:hypothetical protein